ncbi:unnamed protein product [Rhizopus stolonifer]
MGNTTSQKNPKKHLQRNNTLFKKPQKISSAIPSPAKSCNIPVSKSTPNSQTNSAIGDMRICVQNIIKKSSSTTEMPTQHTKSNMSEQESSTTSFKGKRTMCPKANYRHCLPVEETMQDYLMNAHFVIKHLFNGNFSAPVHGILSNSISVAKDTVPINLSEPITPPVDNPITPELRQDTVARVLDIICGTGTWTMEMACSYPDSQFYGIGYDAIYPTSIKPPNAYFSTSDILGSTGFPFQDEHFDYIHMRFVWGYFSESDVKFVMSEINRVLKPGGYFEMRDCDPVMKNTGPIGTQLYEDLDKHIHKHHNIDSTWIQQMPSFFDLQAGLTDIHHQTIPITFEESGPISKCVNNFLSDGIKSYKPLFTKSCDVSPEECDVLIQNTIEEALQRRSYFNFYICWGRKPLTVEKLISTLPTRQSNQRLSYLANNYMTYKDVPEIFPASPCSTPSVLLETDGLSASVDDICQFSKGFIE